MTELWRVVAHSFCAGLVVDDGGHIVNCAPILRCFTGSHTLLGLRRYCDRKGWQCERVDDPRTE